MVKHECRDSPWAWQRPPSYRRPLAWSWVYWELLVVWCGVVAFDVERKRFYESIASCFATWITGSCLGPYSHTRICAWKVAKSDLVDREKSQGCSHQCSHPLRMVSINFRDRARPAMVTKQSVECAMTRAPYSQIGACTSITICLDTNDMDDVKTKSDHAPFVVIWCVHHHEGIDWRETSHIPGSELCALSLFTRASESLFLTPRHAIVASPTVDPSPTVRLRKSESFIFFSRKRDNAHTILFVYEILT